METRGLSGIMAGYRGLTACPCRALGRLEHRGRGGEIEVARRRIALEVGQVGGARFIA